MAGAPALDERTEAGACCAVITAERTLLAKTAPASSRTERACTRMRFLRQNKYLSANCITRGEAAVENDVIRPKVVAELRLMPGLPGMNQLNALNASTRASILFELDRANCRTSERSTVLNPG